MANGFFDKGMENMCNGGFNWMSDDFRLFFVDHGVDVPNLTTDDALDDITGGAVIATSSALSGKSNTAGVLDAGDVTFSAVSGASFESAILYKHTGTPSTSKLWAYWDTITGLPFTPTGTDILFIFDNGANKVMRP
jgi:hypothetical protein